MNDWESWLELKEMMAEVVVRLDRIVELLEALVGPKGVKIGEAKAWFGETEEVR